MTNRSARISFSAFLAALLTIPVVAQAQAPDCDSAVSVQQRAVVVQPSGTDDTDNIQCALDEAKRLGYTTVRLAGGQFSVSQIAIENFRGHFEGAGMDATTLRARELPSCNDTSDAGREPAVLKFIRGDVRVAGMTILTGNFCADFPGVGNVIHFTGRGRNAPCGNDTVFGEVDRVVLLSSTGDGSAVVAAHDGRFGNSCGTNLRGSLRVNRSRIVGYAAGVATSLGGQGRVDLTRNDFLNNSGHVWVIDANQLTTIQSNEMTYQGVDSHHAAIWVSTTFGGVGFIPPPVNNRMLVSNNKITVDGGAADARALEVEAPNERFRLVLTDNRLDLSITGAALGIDGVSDAVIASNRFSGEAQTGIRLTATAAPTRANVISGNRFDGFTATDDILLGADTENNLVGPGQTDDVTDLGSNTVVD